MAFSTSNGFAVVVIEICYHASMVVGVVAREVDMNSVS